MQWILIILGFLFVPFSPSSKRTIVYEINHLRERGCYCDDEWMPSVSKIKWNNKLYRSALNHASDMNRHHYFAHINQKGQDIGKRVDKVGYIWDVVGENIGKGQKTFREVLKDWKKSKIHCVMLMNPKVDEMAVARKGIYWVQHFGKQKPEKIRNSRPYKRKHW